MSGSSGTPVLQWTADDAVSLTLTPSLSSISTSQGAAATTPSATFVNTTDAAAVRVLRLEGDRATPATNDEIYISAFLSDAAGNQDEFGRITFKGWDLTSTSEDGQIDFSVAIAGTLTRRYEMFGTVFRPVTNDGAALGSSSLSWSDLFLASGAVLNFNGGAATITHSSNALEVAGGGFAAPLLASSETTGTLTAASRNRIVNCTGNITLDDGVFATRDWVLFDPGTSARTFTRAAGLTMYVNGTDSASATLPANTIGAVVWRSATVAVLSGSFY